MFFWIIIINSTFYMSIMFQPIAHALLITENQVHKLRVDLKVQSLSKHNIRTMDTKIHNNKCWVSRGEEGAPLLFLLSMSSRWSTDCFIPVQETNDSSVSLKQLCTRYERTILWMSFSFTPYRKSKYNMPEDHRNKQTEDYHIKHTKR